MPAIARNALVGSAGYPEALRRAVDGDPIALDAFRGAGRALGTAIAQIANMIDPDKIVVTGEGLAIFDHANVEVSQSISAHLDPTASPVVLDVHEFQFADYAWAAAIGAVRAVL
jgi:predicted NBD/HSP70 family sugar kinase